MDVFILQSIKPRVETSIWQFDKNLSLSLYPTIHQTKGWNDRGRVHHAGEAAVFILQSIKPRVETVWANNILNGNVTGLYPTIHQTKGWNYI